MRTSAGTSSDLVAPINGCSSSPSIVSSDTFCRYRGPVHGVAVWTRRTVFQPFSSIAFRVSSGVRR